MCSLLDVTGEWSTTGGIARTLLQNEVLKFPIKDNPFSNSDDVVMTIM